MITGTLKAQVNKLWEEFWTGGITNPLTVIEQISFLAFSRLLDMRESREERKWKHTKAGRDGKPFPGKLFPTDEEGQKLRWSHYKHIGKGDELLEHVKNKVFPHMKALGKAANGEATTFGRYMEDAQLMIQRPSLMISTVEMIDKLPLGQADTKGDLYEYLLAKLTTAGINGQFRTPRHIIKMMVELVEPEPTWSIADPACGTGGFLVAVREFLRHKYTSAEGKIIETNSDGEEEVTYSEDLLEPYRKHVDKEMFYGFDFDVTMLRIAAMNLMLHGVDQPNISYQDTLSNSFSDKYPKLADDAFDLVLANPPFKGSLDHEDVHSSLTGKVKTKKTELLFLVLMLRMLKLGGRCAVIVPDGVLFGSSKAHKALRQLLVEDNQLEAVVKLPAGVFRPYAGVSTAILVFTKGGKTTDVWFYNVEADGFTLDDKRDKIGGEEDFQDVDDVPQQWARWNGGKGKKHFSDRTGKAFFVPKKEIAENDYDLSLNRYKEIVHEEVKYDSPKTILKRLKKLEAEIANDLEELEAMLG
jgi:type I restriction enzyme M protein